MSRSLNKVLLIGNVGNAPETRQTRGGNSVSQFSLATSRQWKDHTNTKQERTEWHRCICWQGLSDVVEKFVIKGQRLYVEGTLEYRSWQDKEGQTRYTTEINVKEIIMLSDGRRDGNGGGQRGSAHQQRDQMDERAGVGDGGYPEGWDEGEDPFNDAPQPEPEPPKGGGKKRAAAKRAA